MRNTVYHRYFWGDFVSVHELTTLLEPGNENNSGLVYLFFLRCSNSSCVAKPSAAPANKSPRGEYGGNSAAAFALFAAAFAIRTGSAIFWFWESKSVLAASRFCWVVFAYCLPFKDCSRMALSKSSCSFAFRSTFTDELSIALRARFIRSCRAASWNWSSTCGVA